MSSSAILLDICGLSLEIKGSRILDNVNLTIRKGEAVGLVGESGSGKSMTAKAILGFLPESAGTILFRGKDLLANGGRGFEEIRGKQIGLVCQNPMTSLNPTLSIGRQVTEGMVKHEKLTIKQAEVQAIEMLRRVGFADPYAMMRLFPDQLSGGMRQRIVIAIALSCKPALLIADEPTTSLDVTTQAKILDLLKCLHKEFSMSTLLITHDLGVVSKQCDKTYIMQNGRIVDQGSVEEIFNASTNSYTRSLCWKRR